ncbi:unnamed protein product [Fusarium venenatum]|uniref:NADH:flavin oxidoreductase/NADH oxidase N-terminal domain-containing protein n=1 Tax=Fusarium venenatum TaxID=56646 RepID=A0A2L2TJU3_9HYPO|nr:uncharacterized protein FVRRES_10376 [Fusarium venenatum]CEI70299.1 unnamed protein product [Fusarium venenatum]
MSKFESGKPITLPCGLTLQNRLAKASMSENISSAQSLPDEKINNLYRQWARGGWGLIITGNVQVDDRYLGTSTDLALNSSLSDEAIAKSWSVWAQACKSQGTTAIMQLNHPGRQCPIGAGKHSLLTKNLAPSAIGLNMGEGILAKSISKIAFGVPREMDAQEINLIIAKFAQAARLATKSGFAGVEIHASHGYLLDQFLSKQTNLRTDGYGGDAVGRARLLTEVIAAVRNVLPVGTCIGVLVSVVEEKDDEDLQDRLRQLDAIMEAGVDYLHISGGTFEKPAMFLSSKLGKNEDKSGKMQPYFQPFSRLIKSRFSNMPIIVTGGFRDRASVEHALVSGDADVVGIVRPAAVNPHLARSTILNREVDDKSATFHHRKVEAPWAMRQVGVTALNVHMDNVST